MVGKPSTRSRRTVLVGGICSVASLSGCSMLEPNPTMLDIVVFNNTDGRFVITLYLTASGEEHSHSDSGTSATTIEIEPQEERRRENIAESRPYLVEYDVDKIVDDDPRQTDHDHVHFYPADGGENSCVAFDIVDSGVLNRRTP